MARSITLDDLIALNDELAALARAGMPLESGLRALSTDLPGKLRRISDQLAERLSQGESLDSALAAGGTTFPPLYRAIVAAGIKSGKLPAALEQIGATARRLTALSRLTFLAMLYPLMVLLFGYGLFLFFITQIAPIIYHSAPTFTPPPIVRSVAGLGAHVRWWGPIFPILVIVAVVIWWYRSRRAMVLQSGVAGRLFGWMSPFRRFLNETRAAGLAEMLALLVEHQVPLEQALPLAAETTGDAALIRAARELAVAIQSGGSAGGGKVSQNGAAGIPPLLGWLIASSGNQPDLAPMLRKMAEVYRRRAAARAEWLRYRLPLVFTLAVSGTAVLAYALALFVPWTTLLIHMAYP